MTSCAFSKTQTQLYGEIEKKKRVEGKVISQKKFARVPLIITPNSSEFGRLKIDDQKITNVTVKYKYMDNIEYDQSFEVQKGFIQDFYFSKLERKLEMKKPGVFIFEFYQEKTRKFDLKIKFVRGD